MIAIVVGVLLPIVFLGIVFLIAWVAMSMIEKDASKTTSEDTTTRTQPKPKPAKLAITKRSQLNEDSAEWKRWLRSPSGYHYWLNQQRQK